MESLIWAGSFFAFLLLVSAMVVIAKNFADIALIKGYKNDDKWFWMCLLFGIAGWLMVVALPNIKKDNDSSTCDGKSSGE